MGDAAVEGAAQGRLLALEGHVVAEVVPQAEGDGGQVEAGAADPAVRHPRPVASGGGLVLVSVEGHAPILPDRLRITHARRDDFRRFEVADPQRVGGSRGETCRGRGVTGIRESSVYSPQVMSVSDKPRLAGRQPSNRGGVPRVKTWRTAPAVRKRGTATGSPAGHV